MQNPTTGILNLKFWSPIPRCVGRRIVFHHQEILWHQLGVLQYKSVLKLQIPQGKASVQQGHPPSRDPGIQTPTQAQVITCAFDQLVDGSFHNPLLGFD